MADIGDADDVAARADLNTIVHSRVRSAVAGWCADFERRPRLPDRCLVGRVSGPPPARSLNFFFLSIPLIEVEDLWSDT